MKQYSLPPLQQATFGRSHWRVEVSLACQHRIQCFCAKIVSDFSLPILFLVNYWRVFVFKSFRNTSIKQSGKVSGIQLNDSQLKDLLTCERTGFISFECMLTKVIPGHLHPLDNGLNALLNFYRMTGCLSSLLLLTFSELL